MTKLKKYSILIIIILSANKAYSLDLGMPVACTYGKDCFISNYFDHDGTANFYKDYACGSMSSDGYKSTDFILKNNLQMKDGVNVLAGDSGTVKSLRNDVADVNVEFSGAESVRGYECGNGLIIEHKRGYETQYCHLKKGSINVKPGEKVEKGQSIGEVGLSGLTSFPYLEFTVRINGKALDPFTGEDPVTGSAEIACESLDIYPLWDKPTEKSLTYKNTALLTSGFSEKVPNAQGARNGRYSPENIINNAKLLAFWVDILGAVKGDQLKLSIVSPEGKEIFQDTKKVSEDKRRYFQFIAAKRGEAQDSWPNGEYIGKVELIREVSTRIVSVIDTHIVTQVVDVPVKK